MNTFHMQGIRFALCVTCAFILTLSANAASFDCTKAGTKVEHMICDNPKLSKLDDEMGTAYKNALQNSSQADSIKQSQKRWLRKRDKCLITVCLYISYDVRLNELRLLRQHALDHQSDTATGQTFPLNPQDPDSIPKGKPKPYVQVMSKDNELCNHMMQLFNADLKAQGWAAGAFFDRHEEFKAIHWQPATESYAVNGRMRYVDIKGALFDFNNDGNPDFVVWVPSMLSGLRADTLIMLPASAAKRADELTGEELGKSANYIDISQSGYPMSSPLDGQNEALWLLSPFIYHATSYLLMRPVGVGFMSNYVVISKYKGGVFGYRNLTGKMEDMCYFEQPGADIK